MPSGFWALIHCIFRGPPGMHDPARGGLTLMAFDFGERRIGVAIGNTLTGGARPLAVIKAQRRDLRFQALSDLITEWAPQRLVVGLPRYPDAIHTRLRGAASGLPINCRAALACR